MFDCRTNRTPIERLGSIGFDWFLFGFVRLATPGLFVLIFETSRSGEVMIVSLPSAFQVRSLQRVVKLQTELARRTACFKSSYRRSTTFCKINNEVHAPFHSVFRRSKTPLISC